jgi:lipopolysaccharide transport system ATP-binding protein
MGEVAHEGRTVLFVSHNMAAVLQLCHHGMVLDHGKLSFRGTADKAVNSYMQNFEKTVLNIDLAKRTDRKGSQWLKFTRVAAYDYAGNEIQQVMSGQDVYIRLFYDSEREQRNASVLVSFNVRNDQGYLLANLNSVDSGQSVLDIYRNGYFECYWPKFNLRSGRYEFNLFCSVHEEILDWMQSAFFINVEDGDYFKTGKLINREQGEILIYNSWSSGRT